VPRNSFVTYAFFAMKPHCVFLCAAGRPIGDARPTTFSCRGAGAQSRACEGRPVFPAPSATAASQTKHDGGESVDLIFQDKPASGVPGSVFWRCPLLSAVRDQPTRGATLRGTGAKVYASAVSTQKKKKNKKEATRSEAFPPWSFSCP